MRSVECKVWSVECAVSKVWIVECKVSYVKRKAAV